MSVRTFLAVDLNETILDAIEQVKLRLGETDGKIRWTDRRNLHVTLQFLGEVADETVAEICARTADAARQVEPFDVAVRGIACVPPTGRQLRMVWANVDDSSGEFGALHEIVAMEMSGMGLREENRRFKPHVTLARVKFLRDVDGFRDAAEQYRNRDFGTQSVSQVTVYSSTLTPTGPVYTSVARVPLG